jgi:hypothetical protein
MLTSQHAVLHVSISRESDGDHARRRMILRIILKPIFNTKITLIVCPKIIVLLARSLIEDLI